MPTTVELDDPDFYRAFEDRYRGSRDLIISRLLAYLPFVKPLAQAIPSASAVDLGCGRGEWLQVLGGVGLTAVGVDLDAGMLRDCRQLGLDVVQGEAIAYLSALPDESKAVVSAFHVVEHVSFDHLRLLVAQSMRVLVPGGLLIMETPNPENLVVATRNFYLDPTHQRPIPPDLLAFVAEYSGFARVKVLRLQEPPDILERQALVLSDVFAGVSPDYAVVAQKGGNESLVDALAAAFDEEFGVGLETLVSRYDLSVNRMTENSGSIAQGTLESIQNAVSLLDRFEREHAETLERAAERLLSHSSEVMALSREQNSRLSDQMAARLAQIESSISARRADIDNFHSLVSASQAEIRELYLDGRRLHENSLLRADKVHAQLLDAEVRCARSEASLEGLRAQYNSVVARLEDVGRHRDEAEIRAREIETALNAALNEKQQHAIRADECSKQFGKLAQQVVELSSCRNEAEDRAREIDAELKVVQEEKRQHLARVGELASQVCDLAREVDELRSGYDQAESRAREVEEALAAAEAERVRQSNLAAEVAEKHASLLSEYAELQDVLRGIRDKSDLERMRAAECNASLTVLREKLNECESVLAEKVQEVEYWHNRVLALHASTSWWLTKPIRYVKRKFGSGGLRLSTVGDKKPLKVDVPARVRRPTSVVASAFRLVFRRPRLRELLSRMLKKVPVLHRSLKSFAIKRGFVPAYLPSSQVESFGTSALPVVKKKAETDSSSGATDMEFAGNLSRTPLEKFLRNNRSVQ